MDEKTADTRSQAALPTKFCQLREKTFFIGNPLGGFDNQNRQLPSGFSDADKG